jgi:hypothetical protein
MVGTGWVALYRGMLDRLAGEMSNFVGGKMSNFVGGKQ